MSTANFRQIEHNIPLYVFDDSDLDEFERDDIYDEIKHDVQKLNVQLDIFTVEVRSGYYMGLQLYACVPFGGYEYSAEELAEFDDDDIPYYCDCENMQEFSELYEKERELICTRFSEIAKDYGFVQIRRIGLFSNGEAIYEEVK